MLLLLMTIGEEYINIGIIGNICNYVVFVDFMEHKSYITSVNISVSMK